MRSAARPGAAAWASTPVAQPAPAPLRSPGSEVRGRQVTWSPGHVTGLFVGQLGDDGSGGRGCRSRLTLHHRVPTAGQNGDYFDAALGGETRDYVQVDWAGVRCIAL